MPRNIDPQNIAQLTSQQVAVAFFAQITFKSQTVFCSTLPFNIDWNGQTWLGVGSMAGISQIEEGTDVNAYGTSLTLSGIDSNLLKECLNDIQIGAPAKVWMALFDSGCNIIGQPTPVFGGQVDKTSIQGGAQTVTISIALESPLINLGRGQFRRLTSADQHIDRPRDTSMNRVNLLSFLSLRWGS